MTTPPPLPSQAGKPSRAALIMIWVFVAIGAGVMVWQVRKGWRESMASVQRVTKEKMILNNLRMLSAAADQFCLEHRTKQTTLRDIVGPEKYVKRLVPVDGEDYAKLDLSAGVRTWTIVSASGITVTLKRR